MRVRNVLLALAAIPALSACVNDGATYEIDGTREHVLALVREQPYFWEKRLNLYLVVSRMPTCLRRHSMGTANENTRVEIYQVPSGAFVAKVGKRMYATETQTCESWARLEEAPAEGLGQLRGTFRVKGGELVFVKEEVAEPAADRE